MKKLPSERIEEHKWFCWGEGGGKACEFSAVNAIEEIAKILDELHKEIKELKEK